MQNLCLDDKDSIFCDWSYEENKSEVLILSIDLGDGRKNKLIVHENDNPELLAIEFCQKNMLGPRIKLAICDEIEKNLAYYDISQDLSTELNTLTRTKSAKGPKRNIGHELYQKGIKMKQRTQINSTKIKEGRLANEMKNLTFRPQTNSPERRKKKPEEILLEKGKQMYENLKKKKSLKEITLMNLCTFSPKVNTNCSYNKVDKERSPQRYKSLYHDAESIRQKILKKTKELIEQKCPFEPNLEMTRKKTEELTRKILKPEDFKSSLVNSSSQKPFQTVIPTKAFSSEKSDKIIQKLKKIRYNQIFNDLLPDVYGYISKETVYKSDLPDNIKQIIKPLIDELEDLDENLDFNEFYEAMENLMKTITPGDKSVLLKTSKIKPKPEFYDFKPKTNLRNKSPKRP